MKAFLKRLLLRWRQSRCRHVVYYMETMTARDAAGNVHATCDRCGKELIAECGLDLPAELRQRHGNSMPRPYVR